MHVTLSDWIYPSAKLFIVAKVNLSNFYPIKHTTITVPSSSMIVTVVVSLLMVTGKQVDISLIVMVNILSPSCIMLSIMSTSNDDDVIPAVIVTLYTSD